MANLDHCVTLEHVVTCLKVIRLVEIKPSVTDIFCDVWLDPVQGSHVHRVGQVHGCTFELGLRDEVLEVDVLASDQPQILVIVAEFFVIEWNRGGVAVGFLDV